MKRWLVLGLVLAAMAPVWAKGDKKSKKPADDDSADTSDSDDDSDKSDDDDKKPDKKPDKKAADKKAADKKAADKKAADKKKSKKGDKKTDKGDSDDDDDTPDKSDKKKAGKDDSDDDDKKGDKKPDKKKGDKKADKGDDDATTAGFSGDDASADETGSSKVKKTDDEATETNGSAELAKQDLTGHDLGTKKKTNEFERDRFFVDKTDTEATENGTLIQGSITSSSFAYTESGGQYPNMAGSNASGFSRFFTDLRLQTDFRHIHASRWEARIDARVRIVNGEPLGADSNLPGTAPQNNIQSGLTGQNEYDLRELWLIRNGERTDVIIGRQFINDLAAVKIDGVRIDYASSKTITYLGFAGLYPLRGSRSITTDYADIKDPTTGAAISPYVGSAGFGAAYRTSQAYGAFGGVALVPFASGDESPRIFATANGYYRVNPVLDLYHFALIDLVAASGAQITNLSGGLNYKPNQRLRLTASYNRVDTDSLNIQAQAFLDGPQANPVVQNNLMLQRLATNQARASISAGLGHNERFELTTAVAYRNRPSFELAPIGVNNADEISILEARSVDIYGSITDRVSFKDMRLGIDAVDSFGIGDSSKTTPYQRDETTAFRVFGARELENGHGEWEAEISYASNKDSNVGAACAALTDLASCFGDSNSTVLSAGGTLYYRFNRDWFLIASAYLSRTAITVASQADSPITGLNGYLRFSHRF